jgi:hypothetical protein
MLRLNGLWMARSWRVHLKGVIGEGMRARYLASLLLVIALAAPGLAQDRRSGSLDRVLPHVRQSVPGTFYDAEGPFFGPDGRPTYRLKWMTPDNRIIWFSVDAQTGRVIGNARPTPPPSRYRTDEDRWPSPPPRSTGQGNSGWGSERNNWGDGGNWGDRSGRDSNGWGGRDDGRDGARSNDRSGWGGGRDNSRDNSRDSGRDNGRGGWGGRSGGQGGGRGNDNRGGGNARRSHGG